jgi:hypothetical protein
VKTASRILRLLPALVLAAATGCSRSPDAADPSNLLGSGSGGALLLTRNTTTGGSMEALFEGEVVRDAAGCLRLAGTDGATVVWPARFSLSGKDGDLVVKDAEGQIAGRIGESFRLSGGSVPLVEAGIDVGPIDGAAAEERCPGRFWIVNQVL